MLTRDYGLKMKLNPVRRNDASTFIGSFSFRYSAVNGDLKTRVGCFDSPDSQVIHDSLVFNK